MKPHLGLGDHFERRVHQNTWWEASWGSCRVARCPWTAYGAMTSSLTEFGRTCIKADLRVLIDHWKIVVWMCLPVCPGSAALRLTRWIVVSETGSQGNALVELTTSSRRVDYGNGRTPQRKKASVSHGPETQLPKQRRRSVLEYSLSQTLRKGRPNDTGHVEPWPWACLTRDSSLLLSHHENRAG